MKKRTRWAGRAGRDHLWPVRQPKGHRPAGGVAVHQGDGPHCGCLPVMLQSVSPGKVDAPERPEPASVRNGHDERASVPLRLVSVPTAPRDPAPIVPLRPPPSNASGGSAFDERRANVEAVLGLLLVVLVCIGIVRADVFRRLPDLAIGLAERNAAAFHHDLRRELHDVYAELVWRTNDRAWRTP